MYFLHICPKKKSSFMNNRWKVAQFWEIRWWRWYLQNKDKIPYLEAKAKYWQRILQASDIDLSGEEVLLDAGCGPAGIFMILEGKKVVAIDPLLPKYESQLSHFDPQAYPKVDFIPISLEAYQPNLSFDVIFCCNVINHVADLAQSISHLVSCLKPGGTLVLTVDVHNHQALKHLFRAIPGDILHPHQHDLVDYTDMLVGQKLVIEKSHRLKSSFIFDYYLIKATSPFKVTI